MIPAWWYSALPSYAWQVTLHSLVAAAIFYAWARRVSLPSGRSKRLLLGILLVMPLCTAAVPGRGSLEFRERLAWLDSGRVLAIPLGGGLRVYHVVLMVVGLTVAATIWQEVLPALRPQRAAPGTPGQRLARRVQTLPGWERVATTVTASEAIVLATGGWPWRPRLVISRGALDRLTEEELGAALRHEHAHWRAGRWTWSHALFLLRLAQCYNPVALWSFRAYCLELEITCDAEAVADGDPKVLARALLKVYEATDRRDVAARSALRRRIDVLLGPGPGGEDALPLSSVAVGSSAMLLVLPWFV